MAFYADIYGYIEIKKEDGIPSELLDHIYESSTLLKACFSVPVPAKASYYISFACGVKLDVGEDELWLSPFEMILKGIDFKCAIVNILHEESNNIMMYSYVKDGIIKKFCSCLTEKFLKESEISES